MLIYNDETLFGTNEKGKAIVFDWAHECGSYPKIRVEAVRTFVERAWKLHWLDRKAVKAKFDIEKHTVSANSAAHTTSQDFKVYAIADAT
jgi:hypothetical protein